LIADGKIVETGKPKELMDKYNARNIEEVSQRWYNECIR